MASSIVIGALDRVSGFESAFAFRRAVRIALVDANRQLQHRAAEQFADAMGATVVALLAHGNHYACVWAGDSRAYLWREARLQPITRDHSLVEELIEAGQLRRDQVASHGGTHVVTRAVGARPTLELDGVHGRIASGDRFLLCSDGLGILGDERIAALLSAGDATVAAAALLRQALALGAPDDVSVVVVDAAS